MSLNVIRGFLGASQLQAPDLRVDGGTIQRTYDGGTTWVDSPLDDPRTNPANVRPRTPDADTRCDAASRMIHALHDEFDTFIAAANALEFGVQMMGLLLAIIGTGLSGLVAILFDVAVGTGYALTTIGMSTLTGAFTGTVWDDLVNTLFCHVADDGTLTQSELDGFYADVQANYSSTVYDGLIELGNLLGWVLLSDAYLEYGDTGDCSGADCGWCYTFDFSLQQWGWLIMQGGNPTAPFGRYGGSSFVVADAADGTYSRRALWMRRNFDSVVITGVEVAYAFTGGTYNPNTSGSWTKFRVSDNVGNLVLVSTPTGVPASPYVWSGRRTMTYLEVILTTSGRTPPAALDGAGAVLSITMRGEGDNPFGENNCD